MNKRINNKFITLSIIIILAAVCLISVACDKNPQDETTITDYYISNLDAEYILESQVVIVGKLLVIIYSDGVREKLNITSDMIEKAPDSSELGDTEFIINYMGNRLVFTITILFPLPDSYEIEGLENQYYVDTDVDIFSLVLSLKYQDEQLDIPITESNAIAMPDFQSVGDTSLIVSYMGRQFTFNINIISKTYISYEVDYPLNNIYRGTSIPYSSISLIVEYYDETTTTTFIDEDMITTHPDIDTVGITELVILYKGNEFIFIINILPTPEIPTMTHFVVKDDTLRDSFYLDEPLDISGAVIVIYWSDDSFIEMFLTINMISGYDSSQAGIYEMTISYLDLSPVSFSYEVIGADDSGLFNYNVSGNGVTILGLNEQKSHIVIPDIIEGQEVIAISDKAFYNNNIIQYIRFPDTIKYFGSEVIQGTQFYIALRAKNPDSIVFNHVLYEYYGNTPNLSLSSDIKVIASGAFNNIASLINIDLSDVEYINSRAFNLCTNLISIQLSDNLKSLGSYAFSASRALQSLSIPESVSELGIGVLYNCSAIQSLSASFENYRLRDYFDEFGNIPSSLTAITAYGDAIIANAFNLTAIKSITLADTITTIGNNAFSGCAQLEKINSLNAGTYNIPEGVLSIGNNAFLNNAKLTHLYIPSSCMTIGNYAFKNSTSLLTINIPLDSVLSYIGIEAFFGGIGQGEIVLSDTLQEIGLGAFRGLNIDSITLPFIGGSRTSNKYLSYIFGSQSINHGSVIPASLKTVILKDNITEIPHKAFYNNTGIEKIYFSSNVTSIASLAFYDCRSLNKINSDTQGVYNIPSSVNSIGLGALSSSYPLTELIIPIVNTHLTYAFGAAAHTDLNAMPEELANITLANSIILPDNYLYGITNLIKLHLPYEMEYIGKQAFYNCENLKSINSDEDYKYNLARFIKYIDKNSLNNAGIAYDDIHLIINLIKGYDSSDYYAELFNDGDSNKGRFSTLSIADDATYIADRFFYNAEFKNINLPYSLTKIGAYAFYNCFNLTEIDLFNTEVHTIGEYAFSNSGISDFTLPASITRLGRAFLDSTPYIINNSVIEGGIRYIDNILYDYDNVLNQIEILEETYIITDYAMMDADITSIVFVDSLLHIGAYAFYNTNLTVLNFPESLITIAEGAFDLCDLTSVTFNGTATNINAEAFTHPTTEYYSVNLGLVHYSTILNKIINLVEENEIDTDYEYIIADGKVIITKYIGSDSVISIPAAIQDMPVYAIGDGAFYNNTTLTSVLIHSESLKYIGNYAFYGCVNLDGLDISISHVENIGSYAFSGCSSLSSINFPDSLKYISSYAFYGTGLSGLNITRNIEYIGKYAFYECVNLKNIIYNTSQQYKLNRIEDYAFSSCTLLNSISLPTSLQSIGKDVFSNTLWYNSASSGYVYLNSFILYKFKGNYSSTVSNPYTIPDTCIIIADYALANIPYTASKVVIRIPHTVKLIGNGAFFNFGALERIELLENSQLLSIGDYAFYGCNKLNSINLIQASSFSYIGNLAFGGCSVLTQFMLNSADYIGKDAFLESGIITLKLKYGINTGNFHPLWNGSNMTYSRV